MFKCKYLPWISDVYLLLVIFCPQGYAQVSCPDGDATGIVKNGQTCAELVTSSKAECYDQTIETTCCASCNAQNSGVTGCEFGDRETCLPLFCPTLVNPADCCETCSSGTTSTTPATTISTTIPTTTSPSTPPTETTITTSTVTVPTTGTTTSSTEPTPPTSPDTTTAAPVTTEATTQPTIATTVATTTGQTTATTLVTQPTSTTISATTTPAAAVTIAATTSAQAPSGSAATSSTNSVTTAATQGGTTLSQVTTDNNQSTSSTFLGASSQSGGNKDAAIIGGSIGGVFGLALITGVALYSVHYYKKMKLNKVNTARENTLPRKADSHHIPEVVVPMVPIEQNNALNVNSKDTVQGDKPPRAVLNDKTTPSQYKPNIKVAHVEPNVIQKPHLLPPLDTSGLNSTKPSVSDDALKVTQSADVQDISTPSVTDKVKSDAVRKVPNGVDRVVGEVKPAENKVGFLLLDDNFPKK